MMNQPFNYEPYGHKSRHIEEHNVYQNTDKLYDPLRDVLLHPDKHSINSISGPKAALHSMVTHQYHTLTPQQTAKIVKFLQIRDKTFTSELTHHSNLPNIQKKFIITDSLLLIHKKNCQVHQFHHSNFIILKDYLQDNLKLFTNLMNHQSIDVHHHLHLLLPKLQLNLFQCQFPKKYLLIPQKHKWQLKKTDQNINLHQSNSILTINMIDEPTNRARQEGCGSMTCPSNEIIASRNQPQTHNWLN